jgi:hypothetical protein
MQTWDVIMLATPAAATARKGGQLDAREPFAAVLDAGKLEVAVHAGVAMAGEVLGAGGDPLALEPVHEGHGVARHLFGIAREAAIADYRVGRVGVDVGDRGEVEIQAQVRELAAERAGQRLGLRRRAALAQPAHRRPLGPGRAQAHPPAL